MTLLCVESSIHLHTLSVLFATHVALRHLALILALAVPIAASAIASLQTNLPGYLHRRNASYPLFDV